MFFEAVANKQHFEVRVNESKTHYQVSIRPEGESWKHFDVSKEDYCYMDNAISFLFNQSSYLIDVVSLGTEYNVFTRGSHRTIKIFNEEKLLHESLKHGGKFGIGGDLTAGMPGKIVKILVKPGQEVKEDEPLLIMEAMKMENEMRADGDGVVRDVLVKPGDNVEAGALLVSFE